MRHAWKDMGNSASLSSRRPRPRLRRPAAIFVREKNPKDPLVGHTRVVNFPEATMDADIAKLLPSLKICLHSTPLTSRTKVTDTGIANFAGLPDIEAFTLTALPSPTGTGIANRVEAAVLARYRLTRSLAKG